MPNVTKILVHWDSGRSQSEIATSRRGRPASADVTLDADVDRVVSINLSREAVDVNDLLVGSRVDPNQVELLQFTADSEDQVGVVVAKRAAGTISDPIWPGRP